MELARPSRKTNGVGIQVEDAQICVVMVGLPARGKSLIAQKGMSQPLPVYISTCRSSSDDLRLQLSATLNGCPSMPKSLM
jgi:hypothetical protein